MKHWYKISTVLHQHLYMLTTQYQCCFISGEAHLYKPVNYWIKTQNHPKTVIEALIAVQMQNKHTILDLVSCYNNDQLYEHAENILEIEEKLDLSTGAMI